ncbi:hypothetical protein GCM10027590_04980 [Nocardiopsis nanhaiensis]
MTVVMRPTDTAATRTTVTAAIPQDVTGVTASGLARAASGALRGPGGEGYRTGRPMPSVATLSRLHWRNLNAEVMSDDDG